MFVVVQFPFADLRPMMPGEMGRLPVPDWTADDPGQTFVRGFGKMATRNSTGYGLFGEGAFADFNNAARLRGKFNYRQSEWPPESIRFGLRFRRLYFDGRFTGRFEFGFLSDHDVVFWNDENEGKTIYFPWDLGELTRDLLELPFLFNLQDGRRIVASLRACAECLGLSYIAATTKQSSLSSYLPPETYGQAVVVGNPIMHIRLLSNIQILGSRDRRKVITSEPGNLFITSPKKSSLRNNVIVQVSEHAEETGRERAIRVLFSHINALVFSETHFLRVGETILPGARSNLRAAVARMLEHFEQIRLSGPTAENDLEFREAISAFSKAYSGKSEELASKMQELATSLAQPTALRRAATATRELIKWLTELVVKAGVDSAVKMALKGS